MKNINKLLDYSWLAIILIVVLSGVFIFAMKGIKLKWRKYLQNTQKQLINISQKMTLIQRDKRLTADQKRDRLDLLQRRKNRLVKIAAIKIEGKIK